MDLNTPGGREESHVYHLAQWIDKAQVVQAELLLNPKAEKAPWIIQKSI